MPFVVTVGTAAERFTLNAKWQKRALSMGVSKSITCKDVNVKAQVQVQHFALNPGFYVVPIGSSSGVANAACPKQATQKMSLQREDDTWGCAMVLYLESAPWITYTVLNSKKCYNAEPSAQRQ